MRDRRFRGDGGAATTEFVIIAPLLVSMMMLVVQFGLYFHASSIASAAAQEGAGTAAVHPEPGSRIAHGEQQADEFVDVIAGELLHDVEINGSLVDGGEAVLMTVDANVTEVFVMPGFDWNIGVTGSAESLIEHFHPAGDAPSGS